MSNSEEFIALRKLESQEAWLHFELSQACEAFKEFYPHAAKAKFLSIPDRIQFELALEKLHAALAGHIELVPCGCGANDAKSELHHPDCINHPFNAKTAK